MRFITVVVLTAVFGVLGLSLAPRASAASSEEIGKVQQSLIDKVAGQLCVSGAAAVPRYER